MSNNLWWGYLHTDGSIQVKRYFSYEDIEKAEESPLVKEFTLAFEADNRDDAITKATNLLINDKTQMPIKKNGKNLLLLDFLVQGQKGKAIIYVTPEGNFLSPKAVANKVKETKLATLKELLDKIDIEVRLYAEEKRSAVELIEELILKIKMED